MALVTQGFFTETFHTSGLTGVVRKIFAAARMAFAPFVLGRRTIGGVGSYFDLITDDARLFYGESFHFGYFAGEANTLEQGLEAHTDLVLEMAQLEKATKVLDVGCGIGTPAIRLASRYGAHVTGVNISQEQVRQGRVLIEQRGLSNRIDLQRGNALELEFQDASFDAVLCVEVGGDICVQSKDKQTLVQELFRIVKPGGSIGFSDLVFTSSPTLEEENALRTLLYHEGKELITDWASLFLQAGFIVERSTDILPQTMPTWDYTMATYQKRSEEAARRYGRRRTENILLNLRKIPLILQKYAAFPVLSLKKPA
ncbi:MAG: methyltransferase domain-containing protein [Deltaproteobacteria bacterium]|nr:methyltransferase domain-containing protein [Deltaproteobacteria bacterium]